MSVVLIIIGICVIISLLVVLHGLYESSKFIKTYAEKYSIEEIDDMIEKEEELINRGVFKGIFLEDILDRKEWWENIKKYKLNGKF